MIPVVSANKRTLDTKYIKNKYLVYDKFSTDRAAGSVNGTSAEPIGGTRAVTDTNNKISIASGRIVFGTSTAVFDNVKWPEQTRAAGRTVLCELAYTTNVGFARIGWDNTAGVNLYNGVILGSTNLYIIDDANAPIVGAVANSRYKIAVTMRSSGSWFFISGGSFSNWNFLWSSVAGNGNLTPCINVAANTTAGFTADNMRVPKKLFIPVPLASDGMSAATTDGQGNAENNGPVGTAYTAIGTWGVAGGVRSCSALSGGLGLNYLATSSADVLMDAVCTRSAGVTGIVARYADAQNYLIAYHDGTNAKLDKVEGGSTTNLVSGAATYSASAVMRLVLSGTTARLFYNNAAVGTVATVPSSTAKNHGLYTTDTGATFDNLVIWARGTGNEYAFLDTV